MHHLRLSNSKGTRGQRARIVPSPTSYPSHDHASQRRGRMGEQNSALLPCQLHRAMHITDSYPGTKACTLQFKQGEAGKVMMRMGCGFDREPP